MLNDRESFLMQIGIIGLNHKLANLKVRETLAKVCQKCFMTGSTIQDDHTFVLLSTCNRTEIYFSSNNLAETHVYLLNVLRQEIDEDFDQKIYSYFGQDCFLHLSRVTSGLDSAILGETEIQGQVKSTYENSTKLIDLPNDLHYLFQKSLKIAKKVRTDLFAGHNIPDIKHAVFNIGNQVFKNPQKKKVLFVGASEINCKILEFLKLKNFNDITICNRSPEALSYIQKEYDVNTLQWEYRNEWENYDWIIFGTKSPDFLFRKSDISHPINHKKLIMDLCVPRNVDPKVGTHSKVILLNIDQVNRIVKAREHKTKKLLLLAEQHVAHSVKVHSDLYSNKRKRALAII